MSKSSTLTTHLHRNIAYLSEAITKGNKRSFGAAVTDISIVISNSEELAKAHHATLPYHAQINQLLTEAHKQRGSYLMELKQPEKALADFTAAITYNETYANQYHPALSQEGHASPNYQSAYELRSTCYAALGRGAEAAADKQTIFDLDSTHPYLPKLANFTPNWFSDSEIKQALATRRESPEPLAITSDTESDDHHEPSSPRSFGQPLSPKIQAILQQGSASPSSPSNFLRSPSPDRQR